MMRNIEWENEREKWNQQQWRPLNKFIWNIYAKFIMEPSWNDVILNYIRYNILNARGIYFWCSSPKKTVTLHLFIFNRRITATKFLSIELGKLIYRECFSVHFSKIYGFLFISLNSFLLFYFIVSHFLVVIICRHSFYFSVFLFRHKRDRHEKKNWFLCEYECGYLFFSFFFFLVFFLSFYCQFCFGCRRRTDKR